MGCSARGRRLRPFALLQQSGHVPACSCYHRLVSVLRASLVAHSLPQSAPRTRLMYDSSGCCAGVPRCTASARPRSFSARRTGSGTSSREQMRWQVLMRRCTNCSFTQAAFFSPAQTPPRIIARLNIMMPISLVQNRYSCHHDQAENLTLRRVYCPGKFTTK